jgi:hypothetical protein
MNRIALFLLGLIILTGCERVTEPTPVPGTAAAGGKVNFIFNKTDIPSSVTSIITTLSRADYSPITRTVSTSGDSTVSILIESVAVGPWSIAIDAKNADGKILYSGQAAVEIVENTVTQVNIVMNPVPNGIGSLQINVTWGNVVTPLFPKTYGGVLGDMAMTVTPTADGGYLLGGISHSVGVNGDAWIVKTDAKGGLQWTKNYGTSGEDRVNSLLQTPDGGYILVGYKHDNGEDSWIMKVDSIGTLVWQKTLGVTGDDAFLTVRTLSDGSLLVCGYTYSGNWGVGNFYDGRVVKMTPNGEILWSKVLGGIGGDFSMNVYEIPQQGIFVSGYNGSTIANIYDLWLTKLNYNGETAWEKMYGTQYEERSAAGITLTSDGCFMLTGYRSVDGIKSGMLIKVDTSGKEIWTKFYPSINGDMLKVNRLSDNSLIVSGYTTVTGSGQQGFLMKVNNNGTAVWTKYYGGSGSDSFSEFQVTKDQKIIVVGITNSTGSGLQDFWLLKMNNDGVMQ